MGDKPRHSAVCWGIRFLAGILFLISVQRAWADVWFYRGVRAAGHQDFSRAAGLFEKSLAIDSGNPELHVKLLESLWRLSYVEDAGPWVQRMQPLLEKIPWGDFGGRLRAYRQLVKLRFEPLTQDGLTAAEAYGILSELEDAVRLEPGNAWLAVMTGMSMFSQSGLLDEAGRMRALDYLTRGTAIRPQDYLKPALEVLWPRLSDERLLRRAVPEDWKAYELLLEFMREKNLWQGRREVEIRFRGLRSEAYEKQCRVGRSLIERGNYRQAYFAYRRAFWIDPVPVHARAGMIAARRGDLEKLPWDLAASLREVLEGEREEITYLFPFLEEAVAKAGMQDIYVLGLLAFRQGRFPAARSHFEKTEERPENKFLRYLLAESCLKLDDPDTARKLLDPVMEEEQPDLRELILYEQITPSRRDEILKKIRTTVTTKVPPQAWKGTGSANRRLEGSENPGIVVNLFRGETHFYLAVKGAADPSGVWPYVLIRLGKDVVGTAYIRRGDWQVVRFRAETSGGKRWLNLQLVNGESPAGNDARPYAQWGWLHALPPHPYEAARP